MPNLRLKNCRLTFSELHREMYKLLPVVRVVMDRNGV